MPSVPVPTYQRASTGSPSVAPAALPSIRLSPDQPIEAFGGGQNIEAGVKPISDAVSTIATDARNKANQLAVLDADNQLAKLHTDLQYGPNGAMTKKGKDAFGLYDSVKENWDKGASDIAGKLNNSDQKLAFSKIQSNYWQSLDSNIQRHTAEQIKVYDNETTEASVKNQIALAGLNHFDPKQIGDALGKIHANWIDYAARNGMGGADSEWVKQQTFKSESALHGEVIKGMLVDNKPQTAQGYFDKHKSSIDPTSQESLKGAIEGKVIYNRVQAVSDFADGHRLDDGLMDLTAIHDFVKKQGYSPEDTYKVESHIRSIYAVDTAEINQKHTDMLQSASNEMIDAQSRGVPYQEALKLGSKYGWNNTSMAEIQNMVTKVYASPQEKFNTWITRQPQDVQGAWAETVNTVKAKYGTNTGTVAGVTQKMADAALTELKSDVLGKNADQIREITAEKLKNVVISPGMIFGGAMSFMPHVLGGPKEAESWKADAGVRQAVSEAYSLMEKDYGADRVGQARAYLATHNVPITPLNVKKLLDSRQK